MLYKKSLLLVGLVLGFFWVGSAPVAMADHWDSAVGEARAVERVVRELRRKLDRIPCERAAGVLAARMEQVACVLVGRLESDGTPVEEIQFVYSDLVRYHEELSEGLMSGPTLEKDRGLVATLEHSERMMVELRLALRRSVLEYRRNCPTESVRHDDRGAGRGWDRNGGNWNEPADQWRGNGYSSGYRGVDPRSGVPMEYEVRSSTSRRPTSPVASQREVVDRSDLRKQLAIAILSQLAN